MYTDKTDVMIFGKKGWYYKCPSGRIAVVLTCHKLLNKYFRLKDCTYPPGAEDIRYLSETEFLRLKVRQRLQVPLNRTLQPTLEEYHNSKYSATPKSYPVGI
jgi:hypothetical protein